MSWQNELKNKPIARTDLNVIEEDEGGLRFTTQTTARNINGMTPDQTIKDAEQYALVEEAPEGYDGFRVETQEPRTRTEGGAGTLIVNTQTGSMHHPPAQSELTYLDREQIVPDLDAVQDELVDFFFRLITTDVQYLGETGSSNAFEHPDEDDRVLMLSKDDWDAPHKLDYDFAVLPFGHGEHRLYHRGTAPESSPIQLGQPSEFWVSTVEGSLTTPDEANSADEQAPVDCVEVRSGASHTLYQLDEYSNINPIPLETGEEHDTWDEHPLPVPVTALMIKPEFPRRFAEGDLSDDEILDHLEAALRITGRAVQHGSYSEPFHSDHYTDVVIYDGEEPEARYRFSNEPGRFDGGYRDDEHQQAGEALKRVAREKGLVTTDTVTISRHM